MTAKSQVLINEFLASNSTTLADPDFEDYADWLELYNSGADSVDLGGFFLTDNMDDSVKWEIPAGTKIPGGGFLLIWADGNDVDLHAPFKISADGEILALLTPQKLILDSVSFGKQKTDILVFHSQSHMLHFRQSLNLILIHHPVGHLVLVLNH